MSAHTPGPWKVDQGVVRTANPDVWFTQRWNGTLTNDVIQANARLIAAAPDLLTALRESKRAHHYCEDCWYSCPKAEDGCCNRAEGTDCNCGADAWNAKVDALIAQVEGH